MDQACQALRRIKPYLCWTNGRYRLVDELAEAGFFAERKFGVYRHGGAVGGLQDLENILRLRC